MPTAATLEGRVALVTGASSGLGARFARVLRSAGADVVITARRTERLEALAGEIGAVSMPGDLSRPEQRQRLADEIGDRYGRLDVLVNNAGRCDDGALHEQSLSELEQILEINLVAVLDLCRVLAPLLFASDSASVINISSIYGLVASRAPMIAYNASKGALLNATRHLAAQWGSRRVRVNALAPGYFPTELTGMLTDPDLVADIEAHTLLGRLPTLDELDGPLRCSFWPRRRRAT